MSLSRDDDPRLWSLPGAKRPPFHARILYYDLTRSERELLRAFDELGSSYLSAALETYALLSRMSVRTVYDLIHGRNRNGRHKPGFIDRGILTEKAKAQPPCKGKPYWTPAIYGFHEEAIPLHPKTLERQDRRRQQPSLPGIPRPTRGEPFDGQQQTPRQSAPVADDNRHQVPNQPAPVADDNRHQVQKQPAPVADDSRAFDSRAFDPSTRTDSKEGGFSRARTCAGDQPQKIQIFAPPARDLPACARQLLTEICWADTAENLTNAQLALRATLKFLKTADLEKALAFAIDRLIKWLESGKAINKWTLTEAHFLKPTKEEAAAAQYRRSREAVSVLLDRDRQRAAKQQATQEQPRSRFADPNCVKCRNHPGLMFVHPDGQNPRMTRCDCTRGP